jgi:hypothetical protein
MALFMLSPDRVMVADKEDSMRPAAVKRPRGY